MTGLSRFAFLAMGSECVLDLIATDTRAAEAAEAEVLPVEAQSTV